MNTVADPAALQDTAARQRQIVAALQAALPAHALLWRDEDTTPYECDGLTAYRQRPLVVCLPETYEEVAAVLKTLRPYASGRLICVFGCGGDRDRGKRPAMTKAVADLAHLAWATADNPRKESLDRIFADMREGLGPLPTVEFVTDRRDAIGRALAAAKSGDCVVIAGKGHETTQEFADTVVPFDDRQVVREILELRRGAQP